MTKQIKTVGWRIKTNDGKEYGDNVNITDMIPSPGLTKKAQIKEIREIVKECMQILTEQAMDTMSKVITGKTAVDLLLESKPIRLSEIKVKKS